MPTDRPAHRDLADAVAICARVRDELRNMQQTLGLERAESNDAGSLAAAGELQVIQTNVEDLASLLDELRRDAAS